MIEAFYSRMYTILQRESGTTGLFEINFTFYFNWRFDREITSPLSTIISFDHMFSHIAREEFYQNNLKSLIKHGQAYLITYSDSIKERGSLIYRFQFKLDYWKKDNDDNKRSHL